jgi:hypothetical protein
MKFGAGGDAPGQFSFPRGVAVDPNGILYVLDTDNGRVQVFGATQTPVAEMAEAEEKKKEDEVLLCIRCGGNKGDVTCKYCQKLLCNVDYHSHLSFDHGIEV